MLEEKARIERAPFAWELGLDDMAESFDEYDLRLTVASGWRAARSFYAGRPADPSAPLQYKRLTEEDQLDYFADLIASVLSAAHVEGFDPAVICAHAQY